MERHPSAEGFTLIEVLLATAILGFLLLGIAQLFIMAAYVNVGAQNMTMATNAADRQMEFLLNLQATNPTDNQLNPAPGGTTDITQFDVTSDDYRDAGTGYRVVWRVEDATPAANLKRVTVVAAPDVDMSVGKLQIPIFFRREVWLSEVIRTSP